MDIKWLKTFIAVVEEGSFRAAAEKLFISQPSITVHMKLLEEHLRVQLFHREHTKVKVSAIGEKYYPMAKKLVAQIEASTKEIHLETLNPAVPLIISVSPALLYTNLLDRIHDFIELHQQYIVEIVMEDQVQLESAIKGQQIDVALGLHKFISKEFHSERIDRSPLRLVYSSKLQLMEKQLDLQLKALFNEHPLYIGYLNEHIPVVEWLNNEYEIKKFNKIKDVIFAIKLIKEGLGIGLLPESLISEEIEADLLRVVDIGPIGTINPVDIYMSHLRNSIKIIPLTSFIRNSLLEN
ncbi:Ben and cat operon transcriptional regulator [Solibacillus isronensis B3W22]|uniref:Ben and cat operon transcriptional regulator n=1 Tax=Solibacillus isronensis B3W22 TaxID=1224748 RepID=K1KTS1_9BACL|nr:LysR family transcriptional regulator [Solibacillus isronensis]AMO85021.1 transcriptional regulator [Solibacillus silvestris]EKB45921.1 Ben and cat operon transcriptional regulator [Solibacillus isronensis B3W22]